MTPAGGLPVCWWPGGLDVHAGLVVIGVDGGAANWGTRRAAAEAGYDGEQGQAMLGVDGGAANLGTRRAAADAGYDGDATGRGAARALVRGALREALGQMAGLAPDAIVIQSTPGCAPAVSYPGRHGPAPGISISHDEPLSLAAINLRGPVGVDLMRVQDIPDWRAVAHDYLGPHATALLDSTLAAERAAAFARAWSAHEARLKCQGLQLTEWTPALAARLDGCHCRELVLPAGIKGAVAWRD
jgi:4'-phosphopantetheinyl transferase